MPYLGRTREALDPSKLGKDAYSNRQGSWIWWLKRASKDQQQAVEGYLKAIAKYGGDPNHAAVKVAVKLLKGGVKGGVKLNFAEMFVLIGGFEGGALDPEYVSKKGEVADDIRTQYHNMLHYVITYWFGGTGKNATNRGLKLPVISNKEKYGTWETATIAGMILSKWCVSNKAPWNEQTFLDQAREAILKAVEQATKSQGTDTLFEGKQPSIKDFF